MSLSPDERNRLIDQYAAGPARLKAALANTPTAALQFRPRPGEWSVHEIICHCADSESMSYGRIRLIVADGDAVIQGYDQEDWARRFDYHSLPLDLAMITVEAVRANTTPILRRLTDADWRKSARHTQSGPMSGDDWLRVYAAHLDEHVAQIEGNLAAWRQTR